MNVRTWSAAALILVLVSCSQGTAGIFSSIESEQKVKSAGGLSKVATITHLAELSGQYYIAGGAALFQKPVAEVKWHASSIIVGTKVYSQVMAVGLVGDTTTGTLYAVANKDATNTNRLFTSTDGKTWTDVTPTGVLPLSLVPIRNNDGYSSDKLLMTTVETANGHDGEYENVYVIDSGTIHPAIDLGYGFGFPVTGAAFDGTGYYLVNNDRLMYAASATAATASSVTFSGSDLPTTWYSDVILLPAGAAGSLAGLAVVSTTAGELYWGTLSTTTWTLSDKRSALNDNSGDTLTFGRMLYQNETGNEHLWIATLNAVINQGAGYATLGTDLSFKKQPPAGTDADNYNSTTNTSATSGLTTSLSTSQVPLLCKVSNGTYFAGTAAQGLWNWNPTTQLWSQQ